MNYYYFYYKSNIKLWSTNWIITPFPFHHRRTQWLADWLTDIGDTRELRSPLAASVWLLLLCSVADTLYHHPGEAGLAPGKTSEHYTRSLLYNMEIWEHYTRSLLYNLEIWEHYTRSTLYNIEIWEHYTRSPLSFI